MASGLIAAPPSIESISSPVVQLGKSARVEIIGAGMRQVREIVFYGAGIQATQLEATDEYKLLATIYVDESCEIKNQPFRLRGDDGFSELRTLRVNRYPVIEESTVENSQTVMELQKLNQTVSGVLQAGDYDRYTVLLEKGERFTAEVEAMRLGGDLLDTVLSIRDPHGKLLFVSDDGPLLRQDPSLSIVAPESGRYVVEIHESNYGGSANSRYLLHVGNFPPARLAFPAGGQLGAGIQKIKFVPDSGLKDAIEQPISLPSDPSGFQLFASDHHGVSASPIPFRLNECQNIVELEPNNSASEAIRQWSQTLLKREDSSSFAALAFNGLLQDPLDIDYFAFESTKGQSIVCDVFANRIGSPLDTFLELYDHSGNLLAHNDDFDSHDSKIDFTVPDTGTYILALRDKLNRGFANGVYRIEVRLNQPSMTAFLPRPERISQRQQTVTVPRGNRALARLGVQRDHIDGEVQLRFDQLPSGVRAAPIYVSPGEYWAIAILEADQDAPLTGQLSRVTATCENEDDVVQGGFEQTVDLVAESADRLYHAAVVDRIAVSVATPLPFAIEIQQPQTDLSVDGTIDLVVRLKRTEGFQAAIQVEFPYLPDGCVGESTLIIAPDDDQAVYRVAATRSSITGSFRIAAIASVHLSDGRNRTDDRADARPRERGSKRQADLNAFKDREVASNLIDLRVLSNPLNGKFSGLASEPGMKCTVTCELNSENWESIPTELIAQLEGLPKGVTANAVPLKSRQSKVQFELVVSPETPLGTFKGIQCRLSGMQHDSKVSFVIPSPSELVIAEPGKLVRSDDGSVLSPLEVLRKQNGH